MSDPALSVDFAGTGKTCRVCVAGEIDLSTAEILTARLEPLLTGGEVERVELDLSRVAFMDSSGLRALLQARDLAARNGLSFVLRVAPGSVAELLAVAGVRDWFEYA